MRRKPRPFLPVHWSASFWRNAQQRGIQRPQTVRLHMEQFEERLTLSGDSLSTLVSFNGTNGIYPSGGLLEDSSGNIFGTTEEGGAFGTGRVFEVAARTHTITTLASFPQYTGISDGADPTGNLVEDASGNLFGTTNGGGGDGGAAGTVFELPAGSGTITTLVSFNITNGYSPEGGLVEDASGNLFGTTASGADGGTVCPSGNPA